MQLSKIREKIKLHTIITESGCWEWERSRDDHGYGCIRVDNKTHRLHVLSYILHNGEIPKGLWVLHRCDNPSCCNPAHLFLGTPKDNTKDMFAKGRAVIVKGVWNGNSKLIPSKAAEIRKLHANGVSNRQIAKQFQIHHKTVALILNGITWK